MAKRDHEMPRTMTQREALRLLERYGWQKKTGGGHQIKMVKSGHRSIPLPHYKGKPYPVGLTRAILKQAGLLPGDGG